MSTCSVDAAVDGAPVLRGSVVPGTARPCPYQDFRLAAARASTTTGSEAQAHPSPSA